MENANFGRKEERESATETKGGEKMHEKDGANDANGSKQQ